MTRGPSASDAGAAPLSAALARVARGGTCAGCGGCAALAPGAVAMTDVAPGWLRPVQTAALSAEQEAAIAAICPGLVHEVAAEGRTDHDLWGPYVEMRTGWATEAALRHRAASGGALSALVAHLMESGRVEGVWQVAAGDPAWANRVRLSEDAGDVLEAAGSRYAPSAPLAGIGPALGAGRPLAFVGKPCDVAALRALSRRDPRVDRAFPVMVSFFCAGVPSGTGAEALLTKMGADPAAVTAFRYRGRGWPGHAVATLADGTERSMTYAASWGEVLSKHVQHRCKICPDGTGVDADIACADAWIADDRGYPVFQEADGISLIVARTAKGQGVMAAAEAAGRIETRAFDVAGLKPIQPGQVRRRGALAARLAALRATGRPVPRYRGLRVAAAARQVPARFVLRNFLGMLRRSLRGG
ncbi:MAG: Coenzyme F420 hydrogenase/dehydrogenase, beta subunit C-terminal domain [Pseudomonadota bacterium]